MSLPGIQLQRLVDDLGVTLLEVIEAPGPLDAEVTGAAIFDAHDDPLISPGELLLGVGVATEAEMTALIGRLGKLRAAALVVKAPTEVSAGLRDAVRAHGVPLLGLTRAASWFQVAVLLRTLLDRWTAISADDLAGSPAGDLFAFANAISALVDAPVTVEDRSSRVLAFSGRQEEADTSRFETILGRQVPQRYRQMLEERGIFRELYRNRRPVYMPGLDSQMLPRVAVAVHAGQEVLGSLWVAVKGPLSDERMQALTEAAGLAALHMLHQRNSTDLVRQLGADLLESVLAGGTAAHQAAIAPGIRQYGVLGRRDGGKRNVQIRIEPLPARRVAVQRNNDMAKCAGEVVGDGGEADLGAADGEGWEGVQHQRCGGAVACLSGWQFHLDVPQVFRRHGRS